MSVHDIHEFSKDGIKWIRIFTIPTASIDSKWNCDDPNDFVIKSGKKKGSYGDILDKSLELSKEREKKYGRDEIKEQKFKDYAEKRHGHEHPLKKRERLDKLKKEGIKLKL
jgi:hypothetical protein